ncbi:MAG: LamG domain-containing protein, partial [Pyrinomonadaceae bacterium]
MRSLVYAAAIVVLTLGAISIGRFHAVEAQVRDLENPQPEVEAICTPAPSGIVAWYRGEDNGLDVFDLNDGTLQNGATYTTGKVGRAFDLDGSNDYITIPDSPAVRPANALTVEGWFKFDTLIPAPGENANHLVAKPLGTQFGDSYVLWISDIGHLRGGICDSTTTCDFVDSGFTVQINTWYHVAMTFDDAANSLRIFVDGAQVSQATTNKSIVYDSHPLVIGADIENETVQFFHDGQADEVTVYDRALSLAELQSIYNANSGGKCLYCTPAPVGMASWYQAENDTNDVRSRINGTPQGGIGYAPGKIGQAFNFDGVDDSVELGNGIASHNFSLSMWVRPGATQVQYADIVDNNHSKFQNWVIQQDASNTNLYAFSGTPTFPLAPDVWQHLVVTHDSSDNSRAYVDGVLVASGTHAITYNGTQFLRLGRWGGFNPDQGGNRYWNGQIDEFTIFDRPLTPIEVRNLYQAGGNGMCRPTATTPPSGVVGWWGGDGDALDISGNGNNGSMQNGALFAVDKVGQGFAFDGVDDHVLVPANSTLNVGAGGGLTVEAWVNPANSDQQPFFEWNGGGPDLGNLGAHLWMSVPGSGDVTNNMHGNLVDINNISHVIRAPGVIVPGQWQHVALTYDKGFGNAVIYFNGVAVATSNLGTFTPRTFSNLYLGHRPGSVFLNGKLDEPAVYNRVLTPTEIISIFNTGIGGKLKTVNSAGEPSGNKVGDVTLTLQNLTTPGITQEIPLDPAQLAPLPNGMTSLGLTYDVDTSAVFAGNVDLCFNVPALLAMPAASLRV